MSNESPSSGFQPGVPSNALTSLIAKGVRQHLKAKGIEAKHTDILTGIAKALGLENANALRALAETGADPRGSIPAKHARYFRTRYVFDVLAEDEPLTTHDLSEIDRETDEGRCVGHMQAAHVTPLTPGEMHDELLAAGNDGDFFEGLSDAVDDSPAGRLIAALAPLRAAGEAMDPNDAARAIADAGDWERLTPEQRTYLMSLLVDRITLVAVRPNSPDPLLAEVTRALQAAGAPLLLTAPTSQAARRLTEVTGAPAMPLAKAISPVSGDRLPEKIQNDVLVANADLADAQELIELARALPAHQRLILIGDPNTRTPDGPSLFAELAKRPDAVSVWDSRQIEIADEVHFAGDGSVLDPASYDYDVRYLTPNLRALLRLTVHLGNGPRAASLADARRVAKQIVAQGLDGTLAGYGKTGRAKAHLLMELDPQRLLSVTHPRVLLDKTDALLKELPGDIPIPTVLARRQIGIEQTLSLHGPGTIAPDHVMPLLTRLLTQEMRNAIAAGEMPTLREAYDSVRQGGEALWAEIDPGVEMIRIDADTMIALLETLVTHIGGEADVEELIRQEGITNPHTHRSESVPGIHRPDGDRPVLDGKAVAIAEATVRPAGGQGVDYRKFPLLLQLPDDAEPGDAGLRVAAGLLASHPSVTDPRRALGSKVVTARSRGIHTVEDLLPYASRTLQALCTALAREADYALTLERVLRFVQAHSADHLAEVTRAADDIWTREMLVAEIAAFARLAPRGWQDEQTVASLASGT